MSIFQEGQKLLMFGGKGGVGKTTCAAAAALYLVQQKKRVLIISTDPAPSLSDSFDQKVGGEVKAIKGVEGLFALEIEGKRVLERWKEKFGPEVYEVISSFLPVDEGILDYLGEAPGIEEEFMLNYILELLESEKYDIVIWDTAPTGHTLRLLSLPSIFIRHLEAAGKLYCSLSAHLDKIRSLTGRKKGKRSVFDIVESWKALALKVTDFLKDPLRTQFVAVTIPEAMSVIQTERLLFTFQSFGIKVNNLVVNDIIEATDGSRFLEERKKMQKIYLEELKNTHGEKMNIIQIPLFPYEVRGIERLREYGSFIFPSKMRNSRDEGRNSLSN